VKALTLVDIKDPSLVVVEQIAVLPYVVQNLAKTHDAVIGAAFIINDSTGGISHSTYNGLTQIALSSGIPVIPALVIQESLLEAKALLPALAESWAKSVVSALDVRTIVTFSALPQVKIEVKPVHSADVSSFETLLALLKESIKVDSILLVYSSRLADKYLK
jgi:hypothetical protein